MDHSISSLRLKVSLASVALCLSALSAPVSAASFFDDFNRADGLVGNGWSNMIGSDPPGLSIVGGKLSATTVDGVGGVYRPFAYSGLSKVTADITPTNGFGGLRDRFGTAFLFGSGGDLSQSLEVGFYRSDENYNNSTVFLLSNGNLIGAQTSTFQFHERITPTVYLGADGRIFGSVAGVDGSQFSFDFGQQSASLFGSDFGIKQGYPDGRTGQPIFGTVDNLSIWSGLTGLPVDAVAPTSAQLAKMAASTYGVGPAGDMNGFVSLPGKFIGSRTDGGSPYAETFISAGQNGGRDQVVIAIRGSQPWEDWILRNGTFLIGQGTAEFKSSLSAIAQLIAHVHEQFPDADFTVTGHSLGGSFAQVLSEAVDIRAVAFDAPGAKNTLNSNELGALAFTARSGVSAPLFSSIEENLNLRLYGDVVSTVGDYYDNVSTVLPHDPIALSKLEQAIPGTCVIVCHSGARIARELELGAAIRPGIPDLQTVFVSTFFAELGELAKKSFEAQVFGSVFSFFDPPGAGSFIEIDMLNSTTSLKSIYLPGYADNIAIYALGGGGWEMLGIGSGSSEFIVPTSSAYLISNAGELQDDDGRFLIGMKFSEDGYFRGTLSSVNIGGPVPEPSTWIMLLFGFGGVGYLFRTRRCNRAKIRLKKYWTPLEPY